jgi:hypothetical protein
MAAVNMLDAAMKRGAGNPNISEQPRDENGRVGEKVRIVDNINDTAKEERPTGTSVDAGLRKLQKAANEGNRNNGHNERRNVRACDVIYVL